MIPPSEVPTSLSNEEPTTEPTADLDSASLSKEEDFTLDLVNDPAIVFIGNINESAYSPLEEPVGDDLEDEDLILRRIRCATIDKEYQT